MPGMAAKRPTSEHRAFLKALRALGDNQSEMARVCGCTQGNIWQLKNKGAALPPQYVLKVEAATGVSRHELRPDLYPRENAA